MKVLVVYHSAYGNTEEIARAIAGVFSGEVKCVKPDAVSPADLAGLDLLIVGAPTNGGQATPPVQNFLAALQKETVTGLNVASFDTRLTAKWVKVFGYAAGKIGKRLEKLGGNLVAPPEGFWVLDAKGPLKEGETERAAAWAATLVK